MKKELPKKIREQLQTDETVLWWGKPDMKLWSGNEIKNSIMISIVIIILLFIMIRQICTDNIGLIFLLPFLIFYLFLDVSWIIRKKNTFFIITDKRLIDIFIKNGEVIINENSLSLLRFFEVEYMKLGGNLYLGKYRLNYLRAAYNYEAGYKDISPDNFIYFKSLNNYMNHIDYMSFFDLADVDTPAQIIRERTNAKEYIDPKRKR